MSSKTARVKSDAPDVGALQRQLTRQLQQTIEDTVSAVCDDFQHELTAAFAASARVKQQVTIPAAAQYGAASTADYEVYYSCCQRLVAYIAANMSTSPDFVKQMDRIILACHSNASERVLRSVATKNVWFHRRDGGVVEPASETEDAEEVERPARASPAKRVIKKEKVSPARPTRELSKRRSPAAPVSEPPVAKRLRPTARRSLPLPKYDDYDDDEEEEEEEEEAEEEDEAEMDQEQEIDEDEEDEEEDDDDDDDPASNNQPHYDTVDELLDFKDPVRNMCYVDKRTPAQTKFFKERLRKAILFVDAQLCKPPPGKVCARDCKKIRAVMCDRNLPCRNKICRVWHDVEVHIDRCQNTHCELKNRIMLRETMHKIDHKKLQIHNANLEVVAKKRQREEIKNEEANERERFIELTLLTNEISELEGDIAAAEEELGILNGTKKAFWACLNVVGIELKDDVADGFPDLASHYVNKRQAVPKTRAPKRAAKDIGNYVPESQHSMRQGGDDEAGVSDDSGFGGGPMAPITRRTSRRSTTKSFQAMAGDTVSGEDEDEPKSTEDSDQGSAEDGDDGSASGGAATPEEVSTNVAGAANDVRVASQNGSSRDDAHANKGDDDDDSHRQSLEDAGTHDLNDLSELMPQNGTDSDHGGAGTPQKQVSQIVTTDQQSVVQVAKPSTSSSSSATVVVSSTTATNRELEPAPVSNIQIITPAAGVPPTNSSARAES